MVNDRGTKKWTSLMLPEHVDMLRSMFAEETHEQKPIIDEQQIRENEAILNHAIHEHLVIDIKYFKNHNFQMIRGEITKIASDHLWINHLKIHLQEIVEVSYR